VPGPPQLDAEREVECVVAHRADIADGVVALELRDAAGDDLPRWTPGAHVDLLLPEHVRQYSLCGDPADRSRWRIAVLREPDGRGGSVYVHDELASGATVAVRGPRNHFRFDEAGGYVFIAGGIGITPILPMVAAAHARGARWRLLYGGRRRSTMAFVDELAAYGDAARLWPEDEQGLLDLDAALAEPVDGTLVYCCGPEALLAAVEERCTAWPPDSLRVERFAPRTPEADGEDAPFEIVLERSGVTLTVPPGVSILDVCQDAGISVMSSCEEGTCGTCETDVLEGMPAHRDSVLTASEREANQVMMLCVSRSRTPRLVLDL
jgi:ferredoxin-NADP reductase